jgi:hypothetical protein
MEGFIMNKTVGTLDAVVRAVLAAAVIVLLFTGFLSGILAVIGVILAVILLVTGITGYCPLYSMIGLSTRKKEEHPVK